MHAAAGLVVWLGGSNRHMLCLRRKAALVIVLPELVVQNEIIQYGFPSFLVYKSITYLWKANKLNFKRKTNFENSKKENVEIQDNFGCSYTCLCSE